MKNVKDVVYRFLTDADFFNIYKPPRTEAGGGGQTYIDFQTTHVPVARWQTFFNNVTWLTTGTRAKGPQWTFPIYSIGIPPAPPQQMLVMYQRRTNSVCISSQYIHSRNANRVLAWHPDNGFPRPVDPADRHQLPDGLAVFLVRTFDNEVWAGWFNANDPKQKASRDAGAKLLLNEMLAASRQPGDAGVLGFKTGQLRIETGNSEAPFTAGLTAPSGLPAPKPKAKASKKKVAPKPRRTQTESELLDALFNADEADPNTVGTEEKTLTVKVKKRNQKAVQGLKKLYNNRCQISGSELTFKKQDGVYYTEAHHLVPLGSGGTMTHVISLSSALSFTRCFISQELKALTCPLFRTNLQVNAYSPSASTEKTW